MKRSKASMPFCLMLAVFAALLCLKANIHAGEAGCLPQGFAYVKDYAPDVVVDLRFFNGENFVGSRIDGYCAEKPIMVCDAARALARANKEFKKCGYRIKIYDSYRPQSAVDHFMRWGQKADDPDVRAIYYPRYTKEQLFELDYIAKFSEHTRGSAIDMTVVNMATGEELDVGGAYLLFDRISHLDTTEITAAQQANRDFLRCVMEANGFEPYEKEWWHFHFINEPFPKTYFNFPVQ